MRIAVTGVGGFVGGALAERLAARGHAVVGIYRSTSLAARPDVTLLRCDLADAAPDIGDVDLVVHAAGHTPLMADQSVDAYIRDNVCATQNVSAFAARCGARLLLLSTFSVYGRVIVPVLDECTPLANPGPYGATKYLAEEIVKAAVERSPAVALRLPGVVGPCYFVPLLGRVLRTLQAGDPVHIFNADGPFNNVVDIEELARFCDHFGTIPATGFHRFNLAAAQPMPFRAVVALMAELCGSSSAISEGAANAPAFHVDTAHLESFGFVPRATRTMVAEYVRANLSTNKEQHNG